MARRLGTERVRLDQVDTTMRVAAEHAEAGAPEGFLVVADRQTAGRGRLGRSWQSDPGVGLYFSLVLRPALTLARALPLTLACGLGVARGVGRTCGLQCDIRWPNDVMIGDHKLAGILVESAAQEDRVRYAVVGVGINVNQEELPEELAEIATSLRIETDKEWARDLLLSAVLDEIERYYDLLLDKGSPGVIEAFTRASSYVRGKAVVVEGADRQGVTAGLDPDGMLLLDEDGVIAPVTAGSVRPL